MYIQFMLILHYFHENKSCFAIDSLEEKCLDIGPVEASLSDKVFKLLLSLFQPRGNINNGDG